jgi:hypothetical protein
MHRVAPIYFLCFLSFLIFGKTAGAQVGTSNHPAEQVDFSTEGEVTRTVSLPNSVRTALEEDSFVRETMASQSPSISSLPDSWTKCSVVHLFDEREIDYVVVGQQELTGAHAALLGV